MKKLFRITLSILIAMFGFIFSYSSADTTGMTIILTPGWNVISTPALLSDVSFSNGGNGITFSKLESGQWISVVPNTNEFVPLEGFLVRNTNTSNVDMKLSFRDTTPSEDMLSKKISEGWNLLGITTLNDPFYNITPKLYLDFTSNFQVNLFNTININYVAGNGTVPTPEYGEAYGIFVSSNSLYGGSNNRNVYNGKISNKSDYEPIIKVTPGSYNIPLLKGTITVDKTVSLNNSGLYIEINGANPFEDIGGYEAGGIIYEILVKVDACVGHLSYDRYDDFAIDNGVTDESGYKKLPVYLDKCTKLSAGTHEISVLMGINREYYQNFKTGMTITMSLITARSFNNSSIAGQILPSTIQVGHYNLPQLIVSNYTNSRDVFYINSGAYDFPLRSGEFYTEETGIIANVLFKKAESTGFKMYVSTYVNGELLDEQLYENKIIKHEIPIERNVNTVVEFRGRLASNATGYMRPSVIVNRIIKNDINYITHNCDYYAGWCNEFGLGSYIFYGGGIGIGVGGNSYPTELVQAYDYAYDHGLTTANNIDNAGMYDNITRIEYLQIISDYATNVLGLTPDEYRSCNSLDVTQALGDQYGIVKKACKLGLIGIDEGNGTGATNLNPNMILTRDYFGTLLSRALNAYDTITLAELNDSDPYYQKHLAFLKSGGILNNSNPNEVEFRGYIFLMLMRADTSYVPSEGCEADEILQCLMADDYDACIASCTCTASSSNVRNTSSSRSNALALANVSCMWDGTKATIMWAPIDNIGNVKISLYNEIINNFDIKGTVNMHCQRRFTFNVNQSTAPIVRFDDTEGLSAYKTYTCHRVDTLPTEPSSSNNIVDENYINNMYYAPAPYGYDNIHKISVKNITNTSIIIESPILVNEIDDKVNDYILLYGNYSFDELTSNPALLSSFTEVLFSPQDNENTFTMTLDSNLDANAVYYAVAIPRDEWGVLGIASNEICFKLGDNSFGEGNECSNL